MCLHLPPGVQVGAEVLLGPWGEGQLAILGGGVRECQGERGRSSHHLAVLIVLRAVAGAAELVVTLAPGHDAAKVRAHRQKGEVLDVVRGGDQVVRLALEALDQLAVVLLVRLHPTLQCDGVALLITGQCRTAATAGHRRHEVPKVAAQRHQHWDAGCGHQDEVHQLAALQVWHEAGVLASSPQCHGIATRRCSGPGRHEGCAQKA
mmetsp:Transcript_75762/g.181130  ORF Transcript_75762/g.181130 Transcript_75762/m.181130 type:complete len:206 (-) Transcript_75762:103-720(-)